ncbi:MAG: HD domain-containing phosphohydrolase [bacterium]
MENEFVKCMKQLSVLANQIENGNAENLYRYEDIRDIAKKIAQMVDARDAYNQGHSERKAYYAASIAQELGFKNIEIEIIKISTLLHDIGKIAIGEKVLQKPGKLDNIEFNNIKKHPLISERILTPVGLPGQLLSAIRYHHESPNGKGYPDGLCQDEIPMEASIIKVVDAFSAMISNRPYRQALSFQEAINQLKQSAGAEFDANIVEVFQQIIELEETRRNKTKTPDKKILIGDGEPLNANLLVYGLEKDGFETICAHSGEDVLEKVYHTYPNLILLNACLPDILIIIRRLKNDPRSGHIPIITFGAKTTEQEIKILESGANGHITDIFESKKVSSQLNAYLRRTDYEKSLDPLTGLPGNFFIKEEIKERINQPEKFAILYLDIDNLKAVNKTYGFFQGDEVIKLTAKIITETIKNIGNPTDFIGHCSGDEFTVITSVSNWEKIAHQIISTFDDEIKSAYPPESFSTHPILTISIGIVTNEKIEINNYFQAHALALKAIEEAKSLPGSSYYFVKS